MPPVYKRECELKVCTKFCPFFFFLCSEPNLLVRACNQLGQFLQHRETNLRYLALESMCTLASSEFSHEAVKTHIETVINALKVLYHAQHLALSVVKTTEVYIVVSVPDGEGCECPTEGGRFAVCDVRSKQRQADCG